MGAERYLGPRLGRALGGHSCGGFGIHLRLGLGRGIRSRGGDACGAIQLLEQLSGAVRPRPPRRPSPRGARRVGTLSQMEDVRGGEEESERGFPFILVRPTDP